MKLPATKPKSSPGRTDDFPPPLIMFPRTKSTRGSSSSCTRSRSNPMFIRKINNSSETNQEPSSPKVTCIGQIRVKRSNKLNNKQTRQTRQTTTTAAVRRCKLLRKLERIRTVRFRRVWRIDFSFFRCDCGRKSEKLQESEANRIESETRDVNRVINHVTGGSNGGLISESPPRNVLLLMRSRSAPYRYSSEANKICELKEKFGEKMVIDEEIEGVIEDIGEENEEDEASINGDEEGRAEPLNLSRSKSEPARVGDKFF